VGGAMGRCQSRLVACAVREGLFPHALLLGEDICTQRGPMLSPAFLERHWAPALRHGLEPLLEAGCRPVWHCDGDVRQLLDMLVDCGIGGLQGFQPECGLDIDRASLMRTRDGGRMLIFGPLSVTTELPVCSPEEIRRKVRHAIEVCRGRADLVLFTSNTINPDVPLENIIAMCEAAREHP
jgi:uroporphyrinogen decarboxylase